MFSDFEGKFTQFWANLKMFLRKSMEKSRIFLVLHLHIFPLTSDITQSHPSSSLFSKQLNQFFLSHNRSIHAANLPLELCSLA